MKLKMPLFLKMYNEEGEEITSAPHARQIVKMKIDTKLDKDYMLRKEIISL